MTEKLVIIGSGPAGWTAAIYAARADLQPLLFQGTVPLGQLNLTTEVENFPGFPAAKTFEFLSTALPAENQPIWVQDKLPQPNHGINGPELMELMRRQAANFGTRILSNEIVAVDFKKYPFELTTNEGEKVHAKAVIISTGAHAKYLGLPSEHAFKNNGVSACAVCDGALPRFRNKPLAVVGGGDSAVEEATYLAKFASTVHLIHRRDALRASKIMQERAFANPKIRPHWNREVVEVLGTPREGVTGVQLKNTVSGSTERLEVGGLFLGIGHMPNTGFLKGQVELTEAGYIKWIRPGRTYTSVAGVFAAGDVADDYYRQAVTAAGSGCMAALDAERWLAERE